MYAINAANCTEQSKSQSIEDEALTLRHAKECFEDKALMQQKLSSHLELTLWAMRLSLVG